MDTMRERVAKVKRYDSDHGFGGDMDHTDRGDWVRATDYDAVAEDREKLVAALEFYAGVESYNAPAWGEDTTISDIPVMEDHGDLARAALASVGK